MAIVAPVITAFFDLDANDDQLFTIEDPVLGLLDTGGVLGGDLATDITGYGFSISIDRGRSVELDEISTGTCRLGLVNPNRTFDPTYAAGTFFGNLVPGKRIEVSIYGQTIFTGAIDDLANTYSVNAVSQASVLAIDALGYLATCEFDAWTTTSQLPGERINAVLDRNDVRYAGGRDIDDGIDTLQADNVSWGSNVLNYLQLVARSDLGRLYVSRNGVLTFRDRIAVVDTIPVVTFADDGSGVAFSAVQKRSAVELLRTAVSVDRETGNAQTAVDETAVREFGLRRLSIRGLLLTSDTRSADMAEFLLGVYKEPEDRIGALTVCVSRISDPAVQALLASIDIGDCVTVDWTPDGVGDPVERLCTVEGVSHQIEAAGLHFMTLSLSSVLQRNVFTIEDDVLGVLDTGGVLAY